jgi:tetratricopeptide (TPR) repeat protein
MIVKETELNPKQQNLWKKGLLAIEQKNWDYAVSLILPVVKELPGFLDGRMALRRAEGEMAGGGRKFSFGGGLFKGGSKKDPWEAIADLEDNVFQKDPFNVAANQQLYDLAMKLQFPDLAAFALETIRMGQQDNTKVMHTLADHYMAHDQPEKASEVYRAILKVDPRDMNAVKGEKDSAARTSIIRQGWNQEGDFRKAMKNAEEAGVLELLNKQGRTREQTEQLLARFIDEYNKDQTNINNVKGMAQLYDELEQSDNALMFYEYALTLNPGDVALQRRTELIRDKVRDLQISQMEADIEAHPDAPDVEAKRAQLAQIRAERSMVAINEARARVERNPTDKQVRFDLGQAYFNAGRFTEAIPELQQAKSNPNIRIKAMLLLGRCFERKNMNDLAQSALSEASKELAIMDNTKKEILYELALVNEKMGRQEQYLEALKEIYNADYGYRDVARRVESSYQ